MSHQCLPVVDISSLVTGSQGVTVAKEIGDACRQQGFFYIVGHGVDLALQERLERLSREFFAQDLEAKMALRMELSGRAWRGYFPVGREFTSGLPDAKEGIYFGTEHPADHPRVLSRMPLHGGNLYPNIPEFRETVLEYIDALTDVGQTLLQGVAMSLGLDAQYFQANYTTDPTILFRIFHYPPSADPNREESRGVGEHTDYGLLTILRQDDLGGLQVKSDSSWREVPPISNAFVCNIGDMLDRMTGGLYRSTPHRVKNRSGRGRLSFPFFFDPSFDAQIKPILPLQPSCDRWDGTDLQTISGPYSQYLLNKVSKVFPELSKNL